MLTISGFALKWGMPLLSLLNVYNMQSQPGSLLIGVYRIRSLAETGGARHLRANTNGPTRRRVELAALDDKDSKQKVCLAILLSLNCELMPCFVRSGLLSPRARTDIMSPVSSTTPPLPPTMPAS